MVKTHLLIICCVFTQIVFAQQQPVLNKDFPDPTVIFAEGKYYAFATNSSYKGKTLNIQVAVSDDLKKWSVAGDALPEKPVWGNQDFWAPHVMYDKDIKKYVLFYSAAKDQKAPKCIGVAYADKPEGPYKDKGAPLICGNISDKNNFINIDPMAFIDPKTGKKLLYWGSGHDPIKVQEMKNDWSGFKENSKPVNLIFVNTEKKYTSLVEGAWVDYHKGKYYMYYSGDNCCGKEASYAVLIARADNATGPFETYAQFSKTGSSVFLEKNDDFNAPGHNSIATDARGKKLIFYHAMPFENYEKGNYGRHLYVDKIKYKNGWPKIKKRKHAPSVVQPAAQ